MLRASHWEEGVCYTGPAYRNKIALHMLAHAHRIFTPTTRIAHLDRLAAIFSRPPGPPNLKDDDFMHSLDPSVVDAFRITACFENLFKARLILGGWLIHQIDKDHRKSLFVRQREQPIKVSEIKRLEGHVGKQDIGFEFQSLSNKNLQWSTLVNKPRYRAALKLPNELFDALEPFATKRNSLHFLALNSARYSQEVVNDLEVIRTCFNTFVVAHHNRVANRLGLHPNHLLKAI
jgi:hypothetical protein